MSADLWSGRNRRRASKYMAPTQTAPRVALAGQWGGQSMNGARNSTSQSQVESARVLRRAGWGRPPVDSRGPAAGSHPRNGANHRAPAAAPTIRASRAPPRRSSSAGGKLLARRRHYRAVDFGDDADWHASLRQRRLWPGVDGSDQYRVPMGVGFVRRANDRRRPRQRDRQRSPRSSI